MSRYEVVFSPRARDSLKQVARYIAHDSGSARAADWLARVMDSAVTLETHPNAFPTVGQFEGEDIRARFVMRYVLYYFVDESARVVTVIDAVHTARESRRERYEGS